MLVFVIFVWTVWRRTIDITDISSLYLESHNETWETQASFQRIADNDMCS